MTEDLPEPFELIPKDQKWSLLKISISCSWMTDHFLEPEKIKQFYF